MASITDLDIAGACDTCGGLTDDLQAMRRRAGDNVCEQCDALFTAAHALLDNDVRDEATILSTLAFAWGGNVWATGSGDYGGLELLSIMDGIPLLRLPRITTGVITYDGSHFPKAAQVNVFSRDVKPQELAEVYEKLLKDHRIHFDECSAGSVAWDMEDMVLTLTMRAMKELSAWRVPLSKGYPAGRIYSFPPPKLVSGFYGTLLGSVHDKTFSGYGYALAEKGDHSALKAVMGSVAWFLGERSQVMPPPRERRPCIAKRLNKHLLAPRGEPRAYRGNVDS